VTRNDYSPLNVLVLKRNGYTDVRKMGIGGNGNISWEWKQESFPHTYNINLTVKWLTGGKDSPKHRTDESSAIV